MDSGPLKARLGDAMARYLLLEPPPAPTFAPDALSVAPALAPDALSVAPALAPDDLSGAPVLAPDDICSLLPDFAIDLAARRFCALVRDASDLRSAASAAFRSCCAASSCARCSTAAAFPGSVLSVIAPEAGSCCAKAPAENESSEVNRAMDSFLILISLFSVLMDSIKRLTPCLRLWT
jgi:hypothetical protein